MEQCDVLVVGGGPAGSACAWKLRQQGIDVVVVDRAAFPRDKVCAGWITPPILQSLQLDADDYAQGRVFQPFASFQAGLMGERSLRTDYGRPVSYGIRRCEFDHYLLQRSGARLELGVPVKSVRADSRRWIVNDRWSARLLIGAGGHFCPVARLLSERTDPDDSHVILAQEAEVSPSPANAPNSSFAATWPAMAGLSARATM
jgi:flavin-dependent dehydrogenase